MQIWQLKRHEQTYSHAGQKSDMGLPGLKSRAAFLSEPLGEKLFPHLSPLPEADTRATPAPAALWTRLVILYLARHDRSEGYTGR